MSDFLNLNTIPLDTSQFVWAQLINENFDLIESHYHSNYLGDGLTVSLNYISVTTDLDFFEFNSQSDNEDTLAIFKLSTFNSVLSLSFLDNESKDKCALHTFKGELHYRNSLGFDIQLTSNGALNIQSSYFNGFGGNPTSQGALANFEGAINTYSFTDNTGIDLANIVCNNLTCTTISTNTQIIDSSIITVLNFKYSTYQASPDGVYVLRNDLVYNPTIQTEIVTDFATTATLAQEKLAQYQIVQAPINTGYITYIIQRWIGEDPDLQLRKPDSKGLTSGGFQKLFAYTGKIFKIGVIYSNLGTKSSINTSVNKIFYLSSIGLRTTKGSENGRYSWFINIKESNNYTTYPAITTINSVIGLRSAGTYFVMALKNE